MEGRRSLVERAHRIELEGLDAIVSLQHDHSAELIIRVLRHCGAHIRYIWPLEGKLPDTADVIFVELTRNMLDHIPWTPGDAKSALVIVLAEHEVPDVDLLAHSTADGVLVKPFGPSAVLATLVLACSNFRYHQRLRWRINRLDESLRAVRTVEKAKEILMRTRGLSEEEAYRLLRQQAMSRRMPISLLAQAIVDANEFLG